MFFPLSIKKKKKIWELGIRFVRPRFNVYMLIQNQYESEMLTEHCDDELAYFQVEVFYTVRMQNLVVHDFQPSLVIVMADFLQIETQQPNKINNYVYLQERFFFHRFVHTT